MWFKIGFGLSPELRVALVAFAVLLLGYFFPIIGFIIGNRRKVIRPSRVRRRLVNTYYWLASPVWLVLIPCLTGGFASLLILCVAIIGSGFVVGFLCMVLTDRSHDFFPTLESCRYCLT